MVINGLTQYSITLQIGRRTLRGSQFHPSIEAAQKGAAKWAEDWMLNNRSKAKVLEVQAA